MTHRDRAVQTTNSLLSICLVYPGHSFSTKWIADGYNSALRTWGVRVDDILLHNLVSAGENFIKANAAFYPPDTNLMRLATHIGLEFMTAMMLERAYRTSVFLVVCGKMITPQVYNAVNAIPGNKVVLLTESPYEDEIQKYLASNYDFATVNDRNSQPVINEVVPTVYMPHAFDQRVYYHTRDEKEFDVSFIGTPFGNRMTAIDKLIGAGLNVMASNKPKLNESGEPKNIEVMMPPDVATVYNKSKICLNIHRTETEYLSGKHIKTGDAYSVGPRTFEIAGTGSFQLCDNSRQELPDIFGDTVATFDPDHDDIVEVVKYWLDPERDELREEMGMASLEIVKASHTYEDRAETLVNQLAEWYDKPEWVKVLDQDIDVVERFKQRVEQASHMEVKVEQEM